MVSPAGCRKRQWIMDKTNRLLMWSLGISEAAAKMLNRGGNREIITLRKFVDEWLNEIEPHFNAAENSLHTIFDYQFFYLELRNWEWLDNDEWRDPETQVDYLTNDAIQIQINRDDTAKLSRPGMSEMEAQRYGKPFMD